MLPTVTNRVAKSFLHGLLVASLAATSVPAQSQHPPVAVGASDSGAASTRIVPQTAALDVRKAHLEYEAGLRAEKADNWEAAFRSYNLAAINDPADRTIRVRLEFTRSMFAQQKAQAAERELLLGKDDLARASLQAALAIDHAFTVARERLQQISSPATAIQPTAQFVIAGPQGLQSHSGTHDFDFRGGTRAAYEEVARQFGLIASFDGDLADRQIRFRGEGLNFSDAMRVLGEQTGTFWRVVDQHTFFVAADSATKHRDYDPEVKKTVLLPNSETNDEMTETFRMVREIVGLRRSELDLNSRSITIRDTADNVALAQALIEEVQQAPGEFVLDVDVLEVDRSAALSLGITPPSSATTFTLSPSQLRTLKAAVNNGTLIEAIANIFATQNPLAGSSAAASLIPPLLAFGGGKTIFLAELPGASASFSRTASVLRRAQRVILRVKDGRPATFFVGDHYPVTLALLSASLATTSSQFNASALGASFPRTDFAVGNGPRGVVIGAFNTINNMNPDLVVVNQTDSTLSLLLGNGDGTFNAQTTVPTGAGPVAIVEGSFNSKTDTIPDLAVVNQTDGTVSIFLGNADGTFTRQIPDIKVGNSPAAIVAGNFNTSSATNNNLDLAVVNQTDNSVSILLGNGDGTFTKQPADIAVGSGPIAIAAANFNTNSATNNNLDLAVANENANSVSILLGNGDGTFTKSPSDIQTGVKPIAIAAGEFNVNAATNATNAGLVVANNTDNTVSIFLGNGDGTFDVPDPKALSTGAGPAAVLAADFNGDGIPDVVVADQSGENIAVFLGLGSGAFAPALSLASSNGPVALAAADVNGDGATDIAIANQSSNTVSVILNSNSLNSLLNSANAATTPYPGAEYIDLGLKVHAVPRVHPEGDVSLELQFDISSLAGSANNGIPILSNRTIQQSVRLRPNEMSVVAGMVERSDLRTTTGFPGLANAPGPIGYFGGVHGKQTSDTELLITVTPHQLRLAQRTDRTLYAGRGEGASAPAGLPAGPTPPPPTGQAPAGAQQNPALTQPVQPQQAPQQPQDNGGQQGQPGNPVQPPGPPGGFRPVNPPPPGQNAPGPG